MEHDVTEEREHQVRTRFELAVGRMMDAWLTAHRIEVSAADVKLACEFLEDSGWKVEDAPAARLRVVTHDGHEEEITREAAVLMALRRLASRR